MIIKIVSGGQTGADQASLDAALKYNIPHGGWVPQGRLTENGPLPAKYHLKEMPTKSYPKRTEQNVIDSDGTVIISHGDLSGGSANTREMAKKHLKPYLHIDMENNSISHATQLLSSWIITNCIEVLNVAGARESKDPDIYSITFELLERILK